MPRGCPAGSAGRRCWVYGRARPCSRHRLAFPDVTPTVGPPSASKAPSLWRNRQAQRLVLFFGIGTGAYTLVLAWRPPYYVGLGVGEDVAGYLLAGLTLTEVVAGLVVAAVIDRFRDRRWPLATTLSLIIAGLACLVLAPIALAVPAMILLGLGIGALFPLSLIVTLITPRGLPTQAVSLPLSRAGATSSPA